MQVIGRLRTGMSLGMRRGGGGMANHLDQNSIFSTFSFSPFHQPLRTVVFRATKEEIRKDLKVSKMTEEDKQQWRERLQKMWEKEAEKFIKNFNSTSLTFSPSPETSPSISPLRMPVRVMMQDMISAERASDEVPIIALVGRPNVGKSSLFNRLVSSDPSLLFDREKREAADRLEVEGSSLTRRERRALTEQLRGSGKRNITTSVPGTTRDRLYGISMSPTSFKRYLLVDTGGIALGKDVKKEIFSKQIREQAMQAASHASIVIFMVDASEGITDADRYIARTLRKEMMGTGRKVHVVLCANKVDSYEIYESTRSFIRLGLGLPLCISALNNDGCQDLLDECERRVQGIPPGIFMEEDFDLFVRGEDLLVHQRRDLLAQIQALSLVSPAGSERGPFDASGAPSDPLSLPDPDLLTILPSDPLLHSLPSGPSLDLDPSLSLDGLSVSSTSSPVSASSSSSSSGSSSSSKTSSSSSSSVSKSSSKSSGMVSASKVVKGKEALDQKTNDLHDFEEDLEDEEPTTSLQSTTTTTNSMKVKKDTKKTEEEEEEEEEEIERGMVSAVMKRVEEMWGTKDKEEKLEGQDKMQVIDPLTRTQITPRNRLRIAIVGRPNVGKSSMLNRIVGSERSIVSSQPGTTNDPVDEYVLWRPESSHINGHCLLTVVDTAGIRRSSAQKAPGEVKAHSAGTGPDDLEDLAILWALHAVERAEVSVLVIDAKKGVLPQDKKIASLILKRGRSIVVAVNKWDTNVLNLNRLGDYEKYVRKELNFLKYVPVLFTSTATGKNMTELVDMAIQVSHERRQRVSTHKLMRIFHHSALSVKPPSDGKMKMKIKFVAQAKLKTPTFVLFCTNPHLIHSSYQRYLENTLRSFFPFTGTPIRLVFQRVKAKAKNPSLRKPSTLRSKRSFVPNGSRSRPSSSSSHSHST